MKGQFTICLKAKQKDIKLKLNVTDDTDTLFQKIVQLYPQCTNKKAETLRKIKYQLQTVIQNTSLKSELSQSIRHFLNLSFLIQNESAKVQNESMTQSNKNDDNHESSYIHQPLMLQQAFIINMKNRKQYPFDKRVNGQQQTRLSKQKDINQTVNMSLYKREQVKGKVQKAKYQNKNGKKIGMNADIIKACELIMKKSNQNDMKSMARQYLQQTGCYKQNILIPHPIRFLAQSSTLQQQRLQQEVSQTANNRAITDNTQNLSVNNIHIKSVPERQSKKQEHCQKTHKHYRSNKYRYLESSLVSQTTQQQKNTIQNCAENQVKKYNYLTRLDIQ